MSKRRKFPEEPEPEGEVKSMQDSLVFVVQKHQASRLHYDFRLELDGFLKSWAVPKGPSLNPKEKRLAIMVEDHPLEYRTFEGVIAEGEYGAGEVIVWDQGSYTPIAGKTKDAMQDQVRTQLHQGALRFLLFGEKLRGEFALIRQQRLGEKAWLLIKKRDHYASDANITLQDRSVITGRRLGEAR
ncbi:MAG TPA: DNA polymerase ligase N-terminal domain-containing protein [Ktedonobacteraceae bacterium]